MNVKFHWSVKGTDVFTVKLVKSPSVLLILLANCAFVIVFAPILPKLFNEGAFGLDVNALFHHNPNSVTVTAERVPEFHVAVQAMRYCPALGLLLVPDSVFGTVEFCVTSPVVDCTVEPVPVPHRIYQ